MNFLAHFHLAWPEQGLLVGALEGDYHRGPVGPDLPADIASGIRLHRAIDAYTDGHPLVAGLRRQFPGELRRYAGILIDLAFDHCLSLHWRRFEQQQLSTFSQDVYHHLGQRENEMSSGSRAMLDRLRRHDILNLYHDWEIVIATAGRIGERFRRGNPLLGIAGELTPLRAEMERVFLEFYPQLQDHAASCREADLGRAPGNACPHRPARL